MDAGINIVNKNAKRFQADLLLFLVALIWGSAFVAQRVAAQNTGFFLYNGARFAVAALLLFILQKGRPVVTRQQLGYSAGTGLVLFLASALQQAGMEKTTAANAGFITSLYVVFVPLLGVWIWKQKVSIQNWTAAGFAVFGAFLLSTNGQFQTFNSGDGLELIGAAAWAIHVLMIERGVRWISPLPFIFWHLVVACIPNLVFALFFDLGKIDGLLLTGWSVIYTGVLSIGFGYFLQAMGQRYAPAVDAVLILCLEAVFAGFFGWIFLKEILTPIQLLGCFIILGTAVLVQLRTLTGNAILEQSGG